MLLFSSCFDSVSILLKNNIQQRNWEQTLITMCSKLKGKKSFFTYQLRDFFLLILLGFQTVFIPFEICYSQNRNSKFAVWKGKLNFSKKQTKVTIKLLSYITIKKHS